jgi:hypothetical protein
MWTTNVILVNGWIVYRSYEDGVLAGEFMERQGSVFSIKEVMSDIRRAADMGIGDGAVPQTGDRENLFDGAYSKE